MPLIAGNFVSISGWNVLNVTAHLSGCYTLTTSVTTTAIQSDLVRESYKTEVSMRHRWRARTVGFVRHWDDAVAPHHIPWPVKAAVAAADERHQTRHAVQPAGFH